MQLRSSRMLAMASSGHGPFKFCMSKMNCVHHGYWKTNESSLKQNRAKPGAPADVLDGEVLRSCCRSAGLAFEGDCGCHSTNRDCKCVIVRDSNDSISYGGGTGSEPSGGPTWAAGDEIAGTSARLIAMAAAKSASSEAMITHTSMFKACRSFHFSTQRNSSRVLRAAPQRDIAEEDEFTKISHNTAAAAPIIIREKFTNLAYFSLSFKFGTGIPL